MRRTRKAGKEEPVPTRVNKKGLVLPSLDLLIGLLGSLSVVLILASFPLLGAAAAMQRYYLGLSRSGRCTRSSSSMSRKRVKLRGVWCWR